MTRTGARASALALLAAVLLTSACAAVTEQDGTGDRPDNGAADGGGSDGDGVVDAGFDDHGAVGSLGDALLSASVPNVIVEIDSTPDEQLTDAARTGLSGALADHGGKAVSFTGGSDVAPQQEYSAGDLRRIARANRSESSSGDTLTAHVLVLSGRFENESALGVAFDASSFAIFPDRIRAGVVASLNYDRFEQAVVVHELGHLFGLVNLTGEGGFHEDADNPGHSENRDSVMFWAVEDVSIGNVFRGGPPTTFDADDRREMDRIRG